MFGMQASIGSCRKLFWVTKLIIISEIVVGYFGKYTKLDDKTCFATLPLCHFATLRMWKCARDMGWLQIVILRIEN